MSMTVQTELPDEVWRQLQALIDRGSANNVQEVVIDALQRYLDSHSNAITEKFIRDDVDWALRGND